LDFSNCFDTLTHNKLLSKLQSYGICNNFLLILKNSLENRKQYVVYNGVQSGYTDVTSGVAQGGVLSPMLYNIYVSDLPLIIKSHNLQFADDIILIKEIRDNNDVNILQNDLINVANYCKENGLLLNPQKSECLSVSFKKVCKNNYVINGHNVKNVESHKHLGVVYDTRMLFNEHCDYVVLKAMKKFYTLKLICKRCDGDTFLKLYRTYVLPIIEFSNLCFTPNKSQSERFEKIQKRITKFISFKSNCFNYNYSERLKHLKLDTLSKRRNMQILKTVFKIKTKHCKIPEFLLSEFNFIMTRNGIVIHIPKRRLNAENKYLFSNAAVLFNNLPDFIRNENVYSKFLNYLNDYFLIN